MEQHPGISPPVDQAQLVYTPASLLGVYASSLRTVADGKIILVKGIYQPAATAREYAGHYYDSIKGANDNGSVKLRVPSLLRSKLQEGHLYVFRGFMEKRVNYSAIELVFTVDDILQKETNPFTEEDARRFSLIQQKITKGFRDFEAVVKESVYRSSRLRIANLYGNTAVVNKDFNHGIGVASEKFGITEYRCNFASRAEIIRWLRNIDGTGVDVIALVRGGGDGGLEVFNDPELGAAILSTNAIVVTALGHAVNDTLTDKLADRKFDLPHQYGSSLKSWVDEAVDQQTRSKSVFIDQVKTDLEKTYKERIDALSKQVEDIKKEREDMLLAGKTAFEAREKSLAAQLQTKDEALKQLSITYEENLRARLDLESAKATAEMEKLRAENAILASKKPSMPVWLQVALALLAGIVAGILFS